MFLLKNIFGYWIQIKLFVIKIIQTMDPDKDQKKVIETILHRTGTERCSVYASQYLG